MTTTALALPAEQVREYLRAAVAPNTRRAYRCDWQHFVAWCQQRELSCLPAAPETVAVYLTELAQRGYKVATIQRRVASIGQAHQTAGHPNPCHSELVRRTLQGIRRALGVAPARKAPVLPEHLRAMLAKLPDGLVGLRDQALLLLGFALARRRSGLVALDVADIEPHPEGLVVTIRHSKTDQEGEGLRIPVAYGRHPDTCPVRALQAWLAAPTSGRTASATSARQAGSFTAPTRTPNGPPRPSRKSALIRRYPPPTRCSAPSGAWQPSGSSAGGRTSRRGPWNLAPGAATRRP